MFSEKTMKLCEKIKNEGLKKIGKKRVYVLFNFGSYAYLGVYIYEKLSFEECLYLRSEDIEEYYDAETKGWKKLSI